MTTDILTPDQVDDLRWDSYTEAEWQDHVIAIAEKHVYAAWHDNDPRWNRAGFPDLLLLRDTPARVIWVELKKEGASLTADQIVFGQMLHRCGQEYYVWRPSDEHDVELTLAAMTRTAAWHSLSKGRGTVDGEPARLVISRHLDFHPEGSTYKDLMRVAGVTKQRIYKIMADHPRLAGRWKRPKQLQAGARRRICPVCETNDLSTRTAKECRSCYLSKFE